ncbi:MAG TPA: gliding motility-associated C-terminal domain-containing protein [Saprospiraceae bacterium]|nr:gliding motility-associated C-terminal domain-containing protein [Saprospiraceae bacterium]
MASTKAYAQPHCKILIFLFPDLCNPGQITLETVVFGMATPPYSYAWSTGETTPTISVPNANGTYSVTLTDGVGCMANHEVTIDIANYTYYIQAYNLCPGEEINLIVEWNGYEEPTNAQYEWSTGETTTFITTPTPGYYEVTVTDPATSCSQVLSTTVTQLPGPEVEITGPLTICTGETITLTASGGPFNGISWAPGGETTESIEVTAPGSYDVTVISDNSCVDHDTVIVLSSGVLPQVNGPLNLCNGQNGTLILLNASEYVDIQWSTGDNTATTVVSAPGTYTVTVTDPNGCMAEGYGEVFSGFLDFTGSVIPVTSCVPPNGRIDLTVLTPGSYTFNWSNGSTSEDINGLSQGTYSVTVSDATGCSAESSFVVDANIQLPTLSASTVATVCTLSIGSITLMVDPPGSYAYNWSNGATTQNLSNLAEGTYSVTVTDAVGCTNSLQINVIAISQAIGVTNVIPQNNTSCGTPNGSLEAIMASPGTYSFLWSNGATTQTISNLPAGLYTVTATDPAGCTASSGNNILNDIMPPILTLNPLPAICANPFGNINSNVSPAGNYTYQWSSGETTPNLTDVPPGTYSLTVTDENGCTDEASANVLASNGLITYQSALTQNTLCIGGNGSIVLDITSTSPYTAQWSNGNFGANLNNLSGGQFFVTITNNEGCEVVADFTLTNILSYPTVSGTATNTSCILNTGTIDVTPSPAGTYSYIWSNGATIEDLSNLGAGIYTITITDPNGCQAQESFTISGSSDLTVSAVINPNTSCLIQNGSIDQNISASNAYTVLWSNGATTEDLSALGAGTYTVTITEFNGCLTTRLYEITSTLSPPQASTSTMPARCTAANGSIVLNITAGTNLTYHWSNDSTTQNLVNVAAGPYAVTITDANGCTAVVHDTVTTVTSSLFLAAQVVQNTSCTNPNGAIYTLPGGEVLSSWLWSGGQTTVDLTGLQAGNYSLTVTDVYGCQIDSTFIVTSTQSYPQFFNEIIPADCSDGTGSLLIPLTSPANHQILWSTGVTDTLLQEVVPDTYYVSVTNASGCTTQDTLTLEPPLSSMVISGLINANTSCSQPNGSITMVILFANDVSYLWSTGDTTPVINGLAAGDYSVTVTDSIGCQRSMVFNVEQQTMFPTINSAVSPSYCGQENGTILLQTTPTTGLSYAWNDGSTQGNRSSLKPGNYSVTVTLANGCADTAAMVINEITFNPTLQANVSALTSCQSANGSISINVSPVANYTWLWSNGDTEANLDSLPAGNYQVTLSDDNGCQKIQSYTVADQRQFPTLTLVPTQPGCGQNNGIIQLNTPNVGMVNYLWSDGFTLKDRYSMAPGTYAVTLTSDLGCQASDTITLTNQGGSISYQLTSTDNTSCLMPNGLISIDTTANNQAVSILWSSGQSGSMLPNLAAGSYYLTLSDVAGCKVVDSISIQNQIIYPDISFVLHPGNCRHNGQYLVFDAAVDKDLTYLWDYIEVNPLDTLSPIQAGLHSLIVRTALGCQKDTTVLVAAWIDPALVVPGTISLALNESREIEVNYTGFSFDDIDFVQWAPYELLVFKDNSLASALKPSITPDAEGILLVTIQLQNGCILEQPIEIRRTRTYTVLFPNVISPNQGGSTNGSFFPISPEGNVNTILYLNIYDRWGNLMFRKENFDPNVPDLGWDGYFNGCAVVPGVYVWIAEVLFADDSHQRFKGDLTVVR